MNLTRRDFSAALSRTGLGAYAGLGLGAFTGLGLGAFTLNAAAQQPTEGAQYARLKPAVAPQTAAGKIEVIEFFSYACPHCAAFEPAVEAWSKTLPPDVAFHRVPAPFLFNAEGFTRTYYALETMGKVDVMQQKIFNAVHVDRQRLDKPADVAALATKNGVDGARFLDIYNSFSVAGSVNKAKKLADDYHLDSVPLLAVQGRYTTSPSQAGSAEAALSVVNFLIGQARRG